MSIHDATSLDVIELDAASNRGIDDVREIRDRVAVQPVEGRYKVYILDEAHSLTTDASNALLKTLEEPPAHVVFVLCTTEPHRLLDTIKGRCQAFAFTRPSLDELDTVLRWVATGEGIEIEDAALDLVARAGRGSSRDAISVLDQLATACDRRVTLADARAILGVVDAATLTRIADLVSARDAAGLLVLVDELVEGGQDLGQLLGDLTEHVRLVFLTRQLGEPPRHGPATADARADLVRQAAAFDDRTLVALRRRAGGGAGRAARGRRPAPAARAAAGAPDAAGQRALRSTPCCGASTPWRAAASRRRRSRSRRPRPRCPTRRRSRSSRSPRPHAPPPRRAGARRGRRRRPPPPVADAAGRASRRSPPHRLRPSRRRERAPTARRRAARSRRPPLPHRRRPARPPSTTSSGPELTRLWQGEVVPQVREVRPSLAAALERARPVALEDGVLQLAFGSSDAFQKSLADQDRNREAARRPCWRACSARGCGYAWRRSTSPSRTSARPGARGGRGRRIPSRARRPSCRA